MKANWLLKNSAPAEFTRAYSKDLQVPLFVAELLAQRQINTRDEAVSFFKPKLTQLHQPFEMLHMQAAVDRLHMAIELQQKVVLYGDYDVDGTTAVALMHEQLEKLGLYCDYYIPDRYKEGYGVSEAGINWAIENEVQLLITLDCGIKAHTQLQRAADTGIDIIVCDHHQPENVLPPGIILNPKQKSCPYPYKELCGCGVAFKLLQAYYQKYEHDLSALYQSLDLVALAIGADIVEILGENRILCAAGLQQINSQPRKAFQILLELAKKSFPLTLRDLVFVLAPRINAAGRIASGARAVAWMLSNDEQQLEVLAKEIDQDNAYRRTLDQQITEEALSQLENDPQHSKRFANIVHDPNWHKGVVGIVASRIIEQHYKPTIVLTEANGVLSGSARCMPPLDLYALLDTCSAHLTQFGGHQFAAGLSLLPENLTAFQAAFEAAVAFELNGQPLQRLLHIDSLLEFKDLGTNSFVHFPRILKILDAFEPCGPGNLHGTFLAKNCVVLEHRVLKDAHLKLKVTQDAYPVQLDAIGFNLASYDQDLTPGIYIDLVFQITANTFQNRTTLQLLIKDLHVVE
ncbi:MAG: single-stranded-DNA-specific exonuclease RecJ [Flavobacteriales bacterium]